MYNESRKMEFLNSKSANGVKSAAAAIFQNTEQYEVKLCKDFCEMSEKDASKIMQNYLIGSRRSSSRLRLSAARRYVTWCKQQGYDTKDWIFSVKYDEVDRKNTELVGSPMHLQKFLNDVLSPESEEMIDLVYRCAYWLVFSGVKPAEIYNVKTNDVDLKNMVVRYNNNEYYLYRESMNAITKCCQNTAFRYVHDGYPENYFMNRIQTDQLMRGFKNDANYSTTRPLMSKIVSEAFKSGKTDIKLSLSRAYLSGMFYRTVSAEYQGMAPNFELISMEMAKDKYTDNPSRITENLVKHKANLLRIDYNDWKEYYGY